MNPAESASLARALDPLSLERREVVPLLKPVVAEPWTMAESVPVVDARSGGRCECGDPDCTDRGEVHHHIAGRRGPDPHHPDNLLHLSDAHHRRIHANPEQSYIDGTMRKRNGGAT